MKEGSRVPAFNIRLRQAFITGEALDEFDLRSDDPDSVKRHKALTDMWVRDVIDLIEDCLSDSAQLMADVREAGR